MVRASDRSRSKEAAWSRSPFTSLDTLDQLARRLRTSVSLVYTRQSSRQTVNSTPKPLSPPRSLNRVKMAAVNPTTAFPAANADGQSPKASMNATGQAGSAANVAKR